MSHNKIKDCLVKGKMLLKEHNIPNYALDATVLMQFVTNYTKTELFLKENEALEAEKEKKYFEYINRCAKHEPVQYITGKTEFMGIDFFVSQNTLIPRQETELLVEKIIETIKNNNIKTVLDIGTGSGSIPISIKKYCPNCDIESCDISQEALNVAQKNAEHNNCKVNFIKSNLYENITKKYDLIVSNPPYIKTEVIKTLDNNVKDYEPHLALDGGIDGLDFYRKIIYNINQYINDNGYIFFEIGYDQAKDVADLLYKNNFKDITILKDYSNLDRIVYAQFK